MSKTKGMAVVTEVTEAKQVECNAGPCKGAVDACAQRETETRFMALECAAAAGKALTPGLAKIVAAAGLGDKAYNLAKAKAKDATESEYLTAAGAKWDSGLLLGAAALADKVDAGDSILRARGQFLRDVKAKTLAHKSDKSVDVPATPENGLAGYITARVIPAIDARPDHSKEIETLCAWAKARSWIASTFGAAAAGQTRNFEAIAHYKVVVELHKARKRAVATDEARDSVKIAIVNAQRETAAAFRKALVGAGILDAKAGSTSTSSKPNAGKLVSDLTGPELGAIVAGRPADMWHVFAAIEADKDLAEALCAWIAERPAIMGRAAAISETNTLALAKTGS